MPEVELTPEPDEVLTRVEIASRSRQALRDQHAARRAVAEARRQDDIDAAIRALEEWEQGNGA